MDANLRTVVDVPSEFSSHEFLVSAVIRSFFIVLSSTWSVETGHLRKEHFRKRFYE